MKRGLVSVTAMRRSLGGTADPGYTRRRCGLTLRVFFRGYRVIFDPVATAYDYPAAGTEFRRRRRTLAGLWQLHARFPLFSERNRMRFHFLLHKFSRLLLPWAILLVALALVDRRFSCPPQGCGVQPM